jgi:hypothetical protein
MDFAGRLILPLFVRLRLVRMRFVQLRLFRVHIIGFDLVRRRFRARAGPMAIAVACCAALAARFLCFFFGPPVRRAFLVSRSAALASDLTLLLTVHHSESATCLGHDASITLVKTLTRRGSVAYYV